MTARIDPILKYLAPKRYVPRDYKDNRVGCTDMGALALARIVLARFREQAKLMRYLVVIDLDGACYVLSNGPRVREFVDLHPELVVGVYDRTVDVHDLTGDLESHLREVA